jgi:hypothetical protein
MQSESKQNSEILHRMDSLLALLQEHVDKHPDCCLKSILEKNFGTCLQTSPSHEQRMQTSTWKRNIYNV